jgi:hypothetical protein
VLPRPERSLVKTDWRWVCSCKAVWGEKRNIDMDIDTHTHTHTHTEWLAAGFQCHFDEQWGNRVVFTLWGETEPHRHWINAVGGHVDVCKPCCHWGHVWVMFLLQFTCGLYYHRRPCRCLCPCHLRPMLISLVHATARA